MLISLILSLLLAAAANPDDTAQLHRDAELGNTSAMNLLGYRYLTGDRVVLNVDSGLYWIAKAAALGDPKAAGNLGYLLIHSDLVSHDYPRGVEYLRRASDAGVATATAMLADAYRDGTGLPKDTAQAEALYVKAIHAGLRDAESKLIAMKARQWLRLPVDSVPPLALTRLGDAFARGVGLPYNHAESMKYFLLGALAGDPSAQFIIAETLEMLPDLLDDPALNSLLPADRDDMHNAQYWYTLAAQQGVTNARTANRRLHP